MKNLLAALLCVPLMYGCANDPVETLTPEEQMATTDVLLLSDHTLPGHLNLSSGGANGEERNFIDPTLTSLKPKLEALGMEVYILNVEDMVDDKNIQDKATFDAAYARYDEVLQAAVNAKTTILSVHYDANIIPAEVMGSDNDYIGGAQVILDARAKSEQTLAFANYLISEGKILEKLNDVGLRIRPDYDNQIRFQNNLTMNIIGHSQGGAALLEIGAQEQAQQLFGGPDEVVTAIDAPLNALANSIDQFRKQL